LFQPQGCTYYSPAQQQQQQQQTAPMRRPKAAIPILPPPDNQQSGRGRGRSAQQYQHNNQPGANAQQIEQQEIKDAVMESDEKTVSGQFDSAAQIETSSVPKQEYEKNQSMDMIAITDDTNKSAETSIVEISQTKVDALSSVETDDNNTDNSNDAKELLQITCNEKDSISCDPSTMLTVTEAERELSNIESVISENTATLTTVETERELSNIESAISESTIVEKAAA